ncbi:DUF3021 family protein [Mesobacillus maritimus]|uniref:DUF3021 family protein n=1 Tax=Mesobacillus maritimus TaxID=1643336 RepID=A0ABS7K0D6_9BACI|nr:DUF3021 family protein [Mesobacillus maritimus]MBY0095713.1 DUF3021 family protein [Mesobacillus maritimus]
MKLLVKGLIRGVIPLSVLLVLSLYNKFQGLGPNAEVFFFYGLIAFFLGLASVLYEIKQWSFAKQILVHYLVMLITVFPTLLLSGFYQLHSFEDVLNVYFQFNKVGLILFLSTYLIFRLRKKVSYHKSKILS